MSSLPEIYRGHVPTREKPGKSRHLHCSGVIPYRVRKGELEVLLITTRRKGFWSIPKGAVEPDYTPAESACREAWEEAGIAGFVTGDRIGEYLAIRKGHICRIEMFLYEVTDIRSSWPEKRERRRKWLSLKKASARLREPELVNYLNRLPELVRIAGGRH